MNPLSHLLKQSLTIVITLWFLQLHTSLLDEEASENREGGLLCREDKLNSAYSCRPQCDKGYYSLPGMSSCEPWLTCQDIKEKLHLLELLGGGAVKVVYKANMEEHLVAYNALRTSEYVEDFHHGLSMLKDYQPSIYITQLLGSCEDSYVTEYHPLGSAEHIEDILNEMSLGDNASTRLALCVNYVTVIDFLHSSPKGTRVMCDSNDLDKLLSQFLVNSDLTLVANDLDALPEVKGGHGIKCGRRELYGNFVAPEQLWPHDGPFNDSLMHFYDEKTDIWKIPDVCDHFLGDSHPVSLLHFHLHQIHRRCKEIDPKLRPTAKEILKAYKRIKSTLHL